MAPPCFQKVDRTITHLNRILSTPSGTDTLLLTIGCSTLATSNALSALALHRFYARARVFIELVISLPKNTSIIIPPSTLSSPRLLRISQSLKALSDVISDFRIFMRLWGLLGIWKWGKGLLQQPPKDAVLRRIAWMQIAVNTAYQALENGAYLASKGVLGWDQKKQARAWIWSSRFWAAHVLLEFGRLGYEWRKGRDSEKGKEVEGQNIVVKWRRDLVTNLAYTPLTAHWSLESGIMTDFWVGMLGTAAGMAGFLQLWKDTA